MLTVDFDRLGIAAGEWLLDLGSGTGRHAREGVRRGVRVVALDRDAASLRQAGADAGCAIRADAAALPFPAGSFDRVIVAEVLEHVPADGAVLAEAWRVLRPGGRIAVSVPSWLPEQICWSLSDEYHENEGGHVRIYTRRELERSLTGAGFAVLGGHRAHALHAPYWWLRCLLGVRRESRLPVAAYHRLLVWQLMRRPAWLDGLERRLDPLLGKSTVIYAAKPASLESLRAA